MLFNRPGIKPRAINYATRIKITTGRIKITTRRIKITTGILWSVLCWYFAKPSIAAAIWLEGPSRFAASVITACVVYATGLVRDDTPAQI